MLALGYAGSVSKLEFCYLSLNPWVHNLTTQNYTELCFFHSTISLIYLTENVHCILLSALGFVKRHSKSENNIGIIL